MPHGMRSGNGLVVALLFLVGAFVLTACVAEGDNIDQSNAEGVAANKRCHASCCPKTCAALGFNCGSAANGCGGTLDCGTCTAPATCGGSGIANVCGTPPSQAVASFTLLDTSVTSLPNGFPVSGYDPIADGATID